MANNASHKNIGGPGKARRQQRFGRTEAYKYHPTVNVNFCDGGTSHTFRYTEMR